jgi:hypothetical protein
MPATGQDVVHWQGDTHQINIKVQDRCGNPVSLAGASAQWWAGKTAESVGADIFVRKTSPSGIVFAFDGTFWHLLVNLVPNDTMSTPIGQWYHEAEVTDGNNDQVTVTVGRFIVKPALITP